MFKTIFFSELLTALKRPMIWIFFGLMALLTFGATASDNIQIGGAIGNVYKNAPHVITFMTSIMTIFGLLIATAFFNNAALKDYQYSFNEIIFSTPLSKPGYYFGRFFAALVLSTIPMLGVFFGIFIGSILAPSLGWIDADRIGPLQAQTFINNYFLFILPNMFFAGAIIFAMANKWKSTVISFVGTMLLIVGYIVAGTLMSDIDNEKIAALTDIFGVRAYGVTAKYFTPIEKNTLNPSFSGVLLLNRIIWMVSGLVILLVAYFNFSFQAKSKKVKKNKEANQESAFDMQAPVVSASFNRRTEWLQFKSFFHANFLSITKSVTFKILFLFSLILLVVSFSSGFEFYGLKAYPLTYKMLGKIAGSSNIFMMIVLVFFSGELVWRDRESKIHEVVDSTSHTSFTSLAAKALSLVSSAVLIYVFLVILSIIYQLLNGFTQIELGVYLQSFFYKELPFFFVLSGFLIFIQVLINNKYLGYFVSILILFLWEMFLGIVHVESNMLSIGGGPNLRYSDLNGFDLGLKGALWFNLYWVLFGVLCIMLAGVFWNRGVVSSIKDRFRLAKKQVPKSYKGAFIGVFALWLLVAGNVFYNTQILNPYKTSKQIEVLMSKYEKTYKKYEKVNHPKVTNIKYSIDIFPSKSGVLAQANIMLLNEHDTPLDSLHFSVDDEIEMTFNIPNSKLVLEDTELGYVIYELTQPILPGDSLEISTTAKYMPQGFKNDLGTTKFIRNGTFFNNFDILPGFGYDQGRELSQKNKRKKYDLAEKMRVPKLTADCNELCYTNYLSSNISDYINVETIISTDGDQTAIAPGSLIKKWSQDGRNYYHYKVDHPSMNFYSFSSARYEVAKRKWKDVDIEVYYDKKHGYNIEMMLDAVERSLAYYTQNFGPYYHKQCRIIEFPRYSTFAQAFPGTMPYSESFGFVIDLEDASKNNVIDATISHEMAHQWWAHQVVGATMQGMTMMSESFAEYSSLMTMKHLTKDPMKMRKFLKYDHNRYLRGRSGEVDKELPLYQVENQQYIHYGKGSVILYALQDYIGEDKVNLAMQHFLEEYRYKTPYPTSLDFLRHLEPQVPDSLQYLITDWFKEITLYDYRLPKATAQKMENGGYSVTVDILAKKLKADSVGNETAVVVDDWVDIGLFADKKEERLMFQQRVKINQASISFTFEVDSLPLRAGVDPRHLLIDRVYKDNFKNIELLE